MPSIRDLAETGDVLPQCVGRGERHLYCAMRNAALLITLALGICNPIVVRDIDGEKTVVMLSDTRDSVRVNSIETKSRTLVATDSNVFRTEIDGEKRVVVMLTDTLDSVRINPK